MDGSGSVQIITDPGPGGPKTYGSGTLVGRKIKGASEEAGGLSRMWIRQKVTRM
jgi:hypothetical protein